MGSGYTGVLTETSDCGTREVWPLDSCVIIAA